MSTKDLVAEMTENVNKYGSENTTTHLMVQAIEKLRHLAPIESERDALRAQVEALTSERNDYLVCLEGANKGREMADAQINQYAGALADLTYAICPGLHSGSVLADAKTALSQVTTPAPLTRPASDITSQIIRGACETDPVDPDLKDTLCISVSDLKSIVDTALAEQPLTRPAVPEGWMLVMPGGRKTDDWESARVADFNAGWNQYRKVATAALEKLSFSEAVNVKRDLVQWLRNNYQDYSDIASLCDAMLAAAPQPPGEVARTAVPVVISDDQIAATAGRLGGFSESRPLSQQWDNVYALVRKVIQERAAAPQPEVQPTAGDWVRQNVTGRPELVDHFARKADEVEAQPTEAAQPINLAIIRKWPEGFEARLQHVWLDVISFIPNVKLYDLQRVMAEFGFTMTVTEAAQKGGV